MEAYRVVRGGTSLWSLRISGLSPVGCVAIGAEPPHARIPRGGSIAQAHDRRSSEGGSRRGPQDAKPRRSEGFASIRLLYGGICNTDLELQRGYYGFSGTPGHEFVGEVIDADTPSLIGKRVVGEINLACGKCSWCAKGLGRHCPNRTVLGIVKHPGAFREVLTLPERQPARRAELDRHASMPCSSNRSVRLARFSTGEDSEGRGGRRCSGMASLGLLIAQVLQASGARVHQFGRHRDKLRIAEAAGVTGEIAKKLPTAEYRFCGRCDGFGRRTAAGRSRCAGRAVPWS